MKDQHSRDNIYLIKNKLEDYPLFGVFNSEQNKFMITSSCDILYVDMKTRKEIDFDDREEISAL